MKASWLSLRLRCEDDCASGIRAGAARGGADGQGRKPGALAGNDDFERGPLELSADAPPGASRTQTPRTSRAAAEQTSVGHPFTGGAKRPQSASDETSVVLELLQPPGALVLVCEAVPEIEQDTLVLGSRGSMSRRAARKPMGDGRGKVSRPWTNLCQKRALKCLDWAVPPVVCSCGCIPARAKIRTMKKGGAGPCGLCDVSQAAPDV